MRQIPKDPAIGEGLSTAIERRLTNVMVVGQFTDWPFSIDRHCNRKQAQAINPIAHCSALSFAMQNRMTFFRIGSTEQRTTVLIRSPAIRRMSEGPSIVPAPSGDCTLLRAVYSFQS